MEKVEVIKVSVDQDLCIGCGLCCSSCPSSFELGEIGKAQVKDEIDQNCDYHEIADNCPVGAITVE